MTMPKRRFGPSIIALVRACWRGHRRRRRVELVLVEPHLLLQRLRGRRSGELGMRMLRPSSGMSKSVGIVTSNPVRIDRRPRPELSAVSATTFIADPAAGIARHRPAMQAVIEDFLHARGIEDRDAGIHEARIRSDARWSRICRCGRRRPAPARRHACELPARLPWRSASPQRSTPGPFRVPHGEDAVVVCCRRRGRSAGVPQIAVAARSSFTPGWKWMWCALEESPAPGSRPGRVPPRGEPR